METSKHHYNGPEGCQVSPIPCGGDFSSHNQDTLSPDNCFNSVVILRPENIPDLNEHCARRRKKKESKLRELRDGGASVFTLYSTILYLQQKNAESSVIIYNISVHAGKLLVSRGRRGDTSLSRPGFKGRSTVPLKTFKIYIAETDASGFGNILNDILRNCSDSFSGVEFIITHITQSHSFNRDLLNKHDLIFIEDDFLLSFMPPQNNALFEPCDVILLLRHYFAGSTANTLKTLFEQNSLKISGHLSMTNCSSELMRILVIEIIKTKLFK